MGVSGRVSATNILGFNILDGQLAQPVEGGPFFGPASAPLAPTPTPPSPPGAHPEEENAEPPASPPEVQIVKDVCGAARSPNLRASILRVGNKRVRLGISPVKGLRKLSPAKGPRPPLPSLRHGEQRITFFFSSQSAKDADAARG